VWEKIQSVGTVEDHREVNDSRYQTGAALVAAFLAAAGIAATKGNDAAMWLLVVVGLALLVLTFAPALPGLRKLPRIGAPHTALRFTPQGEIDPEVGGHGAILVRLGLFHDSRSELQRTRVTILIPETCDIQEATWDGKPEARGRELPPTSEELLPGVMSKALQEKTDFDRGWTIWHYAIRLPGRGDFPVRVKVDSKSLYGGGFQQDFQITREAPGSPDPPE
jgi:hypothetical protein